MRRRFKLLKQEVAGDSFGATATTPDGAIPVYDAASGSIVLTDPASLEGTAEVTLENGLLKQNTYDAATRDALDEIRLVLLQILEQLQKR